MLMSRAAHKGLWYSAFGIVNLVVGAAFYVIYIYQAPVTVMAATPTSVKVVPKPVAVAATSGTPVRVVVPAIGVDLAVGVGTYNPTDGSWTLDNERAFYADASVPANDNNGVTLVYGHARRAVFGRLPELAGGNEVIVYTDTGYAFHYVYESKRDVTPADTSILRVDGPPTLVLQTCSGPWDAYRTLVSFRFAEVQKV